MGSVTKTVLLACALIALCQIATAQSFEIALDTTQLVGHPAGPFSILFVLTDGNGVGDANNTVTISNLNFGAGSGFGSPILFGGASGSLETGVTITDSSFLSLFIEGFAPGNQLSFTVNLTSIDDVSGTPDGFTFFLLDGFGVPLPTLAPAPGDYFLTAALRSSGAVFSGYGSDTSRPLSLGGPVNITFPLGVPNNLVTTTASGLAYSRLTKTYNGTVTIQNISDSPINGPFQIFFNSLTVGVTLANATGSLGGTPYLTVPGVASLTPGQKATATVQFSDPQNKQINFTPVVNSGVN